MRPLFLITKAIFTLIFLVLTHFFAQNMPAGAGFTASVEKEITVQNYQEPFLVVAAQDVVHPDTKAVVIKKGTPVHGKLEYKPKQSAGVPGQFKLVLTHTTTTEGLNVLLAGDIITLGENKMGEVLGVGIGVGLFLWPMFFYMFKKGGDPIIARGTECLVVIR